MVFRRTALAGAMVLVLGLVSGCETAEERAEKYYQAGMQLLEAGDVDRALVEFRNVFKLENTHRAARMAYARAELGRGRLREAYAQFLRVTEQDPADLEALKALSEIALDTYNFDEAKRHITAAYALAPADPLVQVMKATIDYRAAVELFDDKAVADAVAVARQMRDALPESLVPRRLLIDAMIRAGDSVAALAEVDAALALRETDRDLHRLRIALLDEAGDDAGVEAQLKRMIALFPDDPSIQASLVRWYVSREDPGAAETYLRDLIGTGQGAEDKDAKLTLVRFLAEVRGPDVAMGELDALIAAGGDVAIFRSLRAGLQFDAGDREAAIAEMKAIIGAAEPSDESRQIKLGLARMQQTVGDAVGARQLVEEVLAEDSTEVEAMKMRALWQIESDQTGEAISTLRSALDQSPRDPDLMTLMARAHDRDGNKELTGEMLALAAQTSNNAPAEAERYARFLLADRKLVPAESVLIDALRLSPGDERLLAQLGAIYVEMKDWPRAEQVVKALRGLDSAMATSAANGLQAGLLQGQSKSDEALTFLEGLVTGGEGDVAVQAAIVRARLNNGEIAAARSYVADALKADPDNTVLRFIQASVLSMAGELDAARTELMALREDAPQMEQLWLALFQLETDAGNASAAQQVLTDGLAELPDSANLKWAQASQLEQRGDIEDAIALYEELYAADSNSLVIANNLASLISATRTDADSIGRAYVVARRLRGSDFPPFQDTFGWIAYLRKSYDEALAHLEPAAKALPQDPSVQFHLAMTYLAVGKPDAARTSLEAAAALLTEDDARPVAPLIRAELAKLQDG